MCLDALLTVWDLLFLHFVTQMVKLVDLDGLETFIQRDAGGFNIKHGC